MKRSSNRSSSGVFLSCQPANQTHRSAPFSEPTSGITHTFPFNVKPSLRIQHKHWTASWAAGGKHTNIELVIKDSWNFSEHCLSEQFEKQSAIRVCDSLTIQYSPKNASFTYVCSIFRCETKAKERRTSDPVVKLHTFRTKQRAYSPEPTVPAGLTGLGWSLLAPKLQKPMGLYFNMTDVCLTNP